MSEDEKISRRYRELPREEPPRHLDDAIRAAARRAVQTRPAPLVVPTGRQRWYFPLAAAAIIVLAVAVTLHVEREQPGEQIVTAPAAPAGAPSAPQELKREEAQGEKPKPATRPERARKSESAASREMRDAALPPSQASSQDAVNAVQESARAEAAAKPAPAPDVAASAARSRVEAPRPAPASGARPAPVQRADEARQSSQLAKLADRSPEQWLQGIADLRRQGRHEEADKALAEFRKRHPDYKVPEAMLEKVERR